MFYKEYIPLVGIGGATLDNWKEIDVDIETWAAFVGLDAKHRRHTASWHGPSRFP